MDDLRKAITARLVSAMPITETSGWTAEQVAAAVAEDILAIPEIAEALEALEGQRDMRAAIDEVCRPNLGHSIRVRDPD